MLDREPFLEHTLQVVCLWLHLYSPLEDCRTLIQCLNKMSLCEEIGFFTQTIFFGTRADLEQITGAADKIQYQT
jgi:hypothetical protein